MKKLIIALAGHAGAGKDTFGKMLIDRFECLGKASQRYAFADHLKDKAEDLGWNGVKDEKGRSLLQHLGDVMREYHGENYFAEYTANEIVRDEDVEVAVVTDLRYKQELEALRKCAAETGNKLLTVRVVRNENILSNTQGQHSSENDLNEIAMDLIVINTGSLQDLSVTATKLVDDLKYTI